MSDITIILSDADWEFITNRLMLPSKDYNTALTASNGIVGQQEGADGDERITHILTRVEAQRSPEGREFIATSGLWLSEVEKKRIGRLFNQPSENGHSYRIDAVKSLMELAKTAGVQIGLKDAKDMTESWAKEYKEEV